MAVYGASKHAIEGYSQSLDHEVREYGIRSLLVEPAYTNTGFEANARSPTPPCRPTPDGGRLRRPDGGGDQDRRRPRRRRQSRSSRQPPTPKPKLRYAAGPMAGRSRMLRRFVPAGIFDKQIRKITGCPADVAPGPSTCARGAFSSDLTRSITMGISTEAQQFAQFLESVRAKASTPGLDLAVVRDIVDTHASASTEPEGVAYADVDADGVPALWVIPEGADPDKALLHFHFGGSVAASISSDRKAAGHIAKAAGAPLARRGLPPGPRHPHPAADRRRRDRLPLAARAGLRAAEHRQHRPLHRRHPRGRAAAAPARQGRGSPRGRSSASRRGPTSPSSNPKVDENEELDKMLSRNILEQFRASLAAGPRRGLHRPRHQHRERRPDRPAAHGPPLRRVRGALQAKAPASAADSPTSRSLSEVRPLPEGQHSFILGAGRVPEVDRAIEQMGRWLFRHLGS